MRKPIRIKVGDVYKAFVVFLQKHFPDVDIMNVEEDYPRPAFFPKLDVTDVSRTTANHIDSEMVMRLYYFPSKPDNSMVELANIQDDLTEALWLTENGMININGVNIEFLDIRFHRVEDVLHCYVFFNIGHGLYSDDEDMPYMEELETNIDIREDIMVRFGSNSNIGYRKKIIQPQKTQVVGAPILRVHKDKESFNKEDD